MDWAASTYESELILEGDYDTSELEHFGKLLVEHMQATTALDSVPAALTEDEWIGKLKVWKESTSTSPSKLHLGHHKSLVKEFEEEDKKPDDTSRWDSLFGPPANTEGAQPPRQRGPSESLESMRTTLLAAQLQLMNYAISHQYVFDRWKTVVNMMILKEENNTKIHRLRVIHLYEADYNLLLGVKWRNLIHHTVDNNLLHPSQYGGIPGRDSITPVFITEMQYEIARATRKPLITLDFDATSCYDRIIENIASLAARSFGQHHQLCFVHARHLQQARYLLKTQLGISDTSYSHSRLFPIYGTGQGSANSPVIWCLISCRLFEAYETYCHGATFSSPCGKHTTKSNMLGFVDDTSAAVNDFQNHYATIETLFPKAQFDAQLWSNVLSSSGGALELPKVNYHAIYFDFENSGTPTMQEPAPHHRLEVDGHDGNGLIELTPLSPNKARKMLGCYSAPTGSTQAALKHIRSNAISRATTIFNSHLDAKCVWRYYHGMFLPSITYSFPANSIAKQDLDKIQSQTTRLFLPRLGYNRNTAKAIVYGPNIYGGIGMRNLWHEQGLAKLDTLVKHLRVPQSDATKHAHISIAWNQYIAGIGSPILASASDTPIHYLNTVWIPDLVHFLQANDIKLELQQNHVIPLLRENDTHIMDHAIRSNMFSTAQLRRINLCRLHLQVHTVSDISTACGRFLLPQALHHNKHKGKFIHPFPTCLRIQGVHQPAPQCNHSWALWRKACNLLCANKQTRKLHQPLGKWIVPYTTIRHLNYLYSPSHDKLYLWRPQPNPEDATPVGQWLKFRRSHLPFRFQSQSSILEGPPPLDSFPVSAYDDHPTTKRVIIQSSLRKETPQAQPSEVHTLNSFLSTLSVMEKALLETVEILTDDTFPDLINNWQNSTLKAASDGSVKHNSGSFGWIISDDEGNRLVQCKGRAVGYPMTSYRAEAFGLWSILLFLTRTRALFNIPYSEYITIYCDNDALVEMVNARYAQERPTFPNETLLADWDIRQEIELLMDVNHQTISWVKGHQDEKTPYEKLPLDAQLNCNADELANKAQDLQPNILYQPFRAPNNPAQIHYGTNSITSKVKRLLRRSLSGKELLRYIETQAGWEPGTSDLVDWDSHQAAISGSSIPDKFVTKFTHDILPTGSRVHCYQKFYSHKCPSCFADHEDLTHFLLCPHPDRLKWISPLIKDLREVCKKTKMTGELTQLLIDGVYCYLHDTQLENPQSYPDSIQGLIAEQEQIGWQQLLRGRISKQWRQLHDSSFSARSIKKTNMNSGTYWASKIINTIWGHIYKLWITRNQARHGIDAPEQKAKLRLQHLSELQMYYEYRDQALLLPSELNSYMFYPTYQEHVHHESAAHQLDTWLCTYRDILQTSHKKKKKLLRSCPHLTPPPSPTQTPPQSPTHLPFMSSSPTVPPHLRNPAWEEIDLNTTTTPPSPTQISLGSPTYMDIDVLKQPLDK